MRVRLTTSGLLLCSVLTGAGADLASSVHHKAPRVWFVNNSASRTGDGSREAPFQRLKQAEIASAPGDTLFVFAGDGSSRGLDEGVVLKHAQTLIGEAVGLGDIPPGRTPTLSHPGGIVIALQGSATVAGLALQGGKLGIGGHTASEISLEALHFGNISGDAIDLGDPGASGNDRGGALQLEGCRVERVSGHGLRIDKRAPGALKLQVVSSSFAGNGIDLKTTNSGIRLEISDGTADVYVAGNRFTGLDGSGFVARMSGQAGAQAPVAIEVANNVFRNLDNNGVAFDWADEARGRVQIDGNLFEGEAGLGGVDPDEAIDLAIVGGDSSPVVTAIVGGRDASSANTIRRWGDAGIRVQSHGRNLSGKISVTIAGNTIAETGAEAILVESDDRNRFDVAILDNRLGETTGGIASRFRDSDAAETRLVLIGNTSPRYALARQANTSQGLACADKRQPCPLPFGELAGDADDVVVLLQHNGNRSAVGDLTVAHVALTGTDGALSILPPGKD